MHELREMLCDELDRITQKGELSAGSLDVIDKLTHSIKSIDTILAMENKYSGEYYPRESYARRRDSRGRYSSRGYSRGAEMDDLKADLHGLLEDATSEEERKMIRKWINQIGG